MPDEAKIKKYPSRYSASCQILAKILMKTLFFLEVIADVGSSSYQHPLATWAKDYLVDSTLFDFDNLSDPITYHYATDLLAKSTQTLVVITIGSSEAPAGRLLPFLEQLVSQHPLGSVLLQGNHSLIERMLSLLPADNVSKTSDVSSAQQFIASKLAT